MQPIVEFLPAVSNKTHRKRAAMQRIMQKLGELLDDPEGAALLEKLGVIRSRHCETCRLMVKKSQEKPDTKFGACRAKWHKIKAQLEAMGCVECGMHGVDAMSVEHTDPSEKKRDANGDPVCLGRYALWYALGGPEVMQAEFEKPSVVPMCLNCQHMSPTHNAMKPRLDPATLPDVRYRDDKVAYHKKYHLTERRKKQAYVDGKKLEIGECAECWMQVVPFGSTYSPGYSAYPHTFHYAHRSELDWGGHVGKIVVSGRTFNTCKSELDREMDRSRLLCANCAKVETDARQSAPGPSEEGN
tara:strand:+ start:174 stop:1073 length:900 start_codon:yes stop_codon:yes gene_type:complete